LLAGAAVGGPLAEQGAACGAAAGDVDQAGAKDAGDGVAPTELLVMMNCWLQPPQQSHWSMLAPLLADWL
jgi:hypothetical protein